MQEDSNKKLLKLTENQHIPLNSTMKKNSYRYLSRHHAEFLEADLKDQVVKRRDVVRWNFAGDLNQNMRLKRVADMVKRMKRIKEVRLVTISDETLSEKEFAELSEAIKRQRGLQKIHMDWILTSDDGLKAKQVKALTQGFQRVPTLKDLHVDIDDIEISDREFNVLSESFKRLCALKNLSIKFNMTDQITDKGLEDFGKNLRRLDSLRKIAIESRSKGITNEGLQALGQYLQRVKSLEHIWLSLMWLGMDGLKKASEVLKEIPQLKKTTIDFTVQAYRYRGDVFIKEHLCSGLQEFKSFKNLCLKTLSVGRISDDGLKLLCEILEKLEFLNELSLHCGHEITQKGMQILSQTIRKFSCLKTLDLSIHCEELADDDISLISEGLKELQLLESIDLMIPKGVAVTNKGLKTLAECLKSLKSLKTVKIELAKFNEIDDKGIDMLTRDLQEFSLLKSVTLRFRECPKITNESLKIINQNLKQIPKLQEVRLNFDRCEQIGVKEAFELKDSLKKKFICKLRHSSDSIGPWDYP